MMKYEHNVSTFGYIH